MIKSSSPPDDSTACFTKVAAAARYCHGRSSVSPDNRTTAPRVEVKVQSLSGILAACGDSSDNEKWLTATVAFSGSAHNMQVGSSTLCGETGLLVVESEPVLLSQDRNSGDPIEFTWLSVDDQPHLTVTDVLTSAVKTPLQKANRDSIIVQTQDILGASSNNPTKLEKSHRSDTSRLSTGALQSARSTSCAAFWSDATPEILELTVHVGDNQGVAFLVFFGHEDDQGTCVMDLPIRRPATSSDSKMNSVFSDEARLRVQIKVVVPDKACALPPIASCSTGSSASMDRALQQQPQQQQYPIAFTRSGIEAQMAPLLKKIRRHEQDALDQRHAPKWDIDVQLNQENQLPSSSRSFCDLWNWDQIRETVAACHRSTYRTRQDNACDSSTIGTRNSWEL